MVWRSGLVGLLRKEEPPTVARQRLKFGPGMNRPSQEERNWLSYPMQKCKSPGSMPGLVSQRCCCRHPEVVSSATAGDLRAYSATLDDRSIQRGEE